MCLYIDNSQKITWPKYGKGFKVFWKKFYFYGSRITGYYQVSYSYNHGWNFPTTLYVDKSKKIISGGCFHVYTNRYVNMYTKIINPELLPVICHKDDLIALGSHNDAVFKKIYIPKYDYDKYKNNDYTKMDSRDMFRMYKKELYAHTYLKSKDDI